MTEKHAGGRPRKFKTVAAMEKKIEAYFKKCDARTVSTVVTKGKGKVLVKVPKPEPYTIQGLAIYLDLTTEGLREYSKKDDFSATVKNARARIEANKVTHMLDGDGYGPGYIFDLKNNFGWKDKKEISGPDDGPIQVDDLRGMTNAQLEKRLKILRKGRKDAK